MIAGLEEISVKARSASAVAAVNDMRPKERDVGLAFQNYALYPHMTVRENMSFALMLANTPKADIEAKVGKAAGILGTGRIARALSAPAVRRAAPARRDGPRDRARPAGVPVRRAAVQPRRAVARADAHRDPRAAPAAGDDVDLRDAHDQIEAMTMADKIVDKATASSSRPAACWSSTTGRSTCSSQASSDRRRCNMLPGTIARGGGQPQGAARQRRCAST